MFISQTPKNEFRWTSVRRVWLIIFCIPPWKWSFSWCASSPNSYLALSVIPTKFNLQIPLGTKFIQTENENSSFYALRKNVSNKMLFDLICVVVFKIGVWSVFKKQSCKWNDWDSPLQFAVIGQHLTAKTVRRCDGFLWAAFIKRRPCTLSSPPPTTCNNRERAYSQARDELVPEPLVVKF